jgi:uncharacterized protein (DUF488 family)
MRDGSLVEISENEWEITSHARNSVRSLNRETANDVSYILGTYGNLGTDELISTVYERFPWYTINSEIRKLETRRIAPPKVYTAGYQGLSIDGFLDNLLRKGIERICDVRKNPVSRRYGFHGSTLSRLCGYLGLEYLHFPQLGIEGQFRQNLHSQEDYVRLFEYYMKSVLSAQVNSILEIADLMREAPSVLVCQEAEPECCHRSYLAEAISARNGLPIRHI